MAVNEEKQSPEEKASESEDVKSKSKKVTDDLLNGMDLPEVEEEEEEGEEGEEEVEEDEEEEEESDKNEDDDNEEDEEEESEEEEGKEETVPKSELDKLQKKFENRLKQESAKIRKLEAQVKTNKPVDKDQEKLDAMTPKELKSLKREVRLKFKNETDDTKANQWLDLEDKIDETLSDAPRKLLQTQVELYDERAAEIMEIEGNLPEDAVAFIKEKAAAIYKSDKVYQRSENGQKLALDLAYEHYTEIRKASGKSSKKGNVKLKRKVNKMKKKISLSKSSLTGKKTGKALKRLEKKAIGGTAHDKENFVANHPLFKVDAMVPEDL